MSENRKTRREELNHIRPGQFEIDLEALRRKGYNVTVVMKEGVTSTVICTHSERGIIPIYTQEAIDILHVKLGDDDAHRVLAIGEHLFNRELFINEVREVC